MVEKNDKIVIVLNFRSVFDTVFFKNWMTLSNWYHYILVIYYKNTKSGIKKKYLNLSGTIIMK